MNGSGSSNQVSGSDEPLSRVKEHLGVKGKPPIIQPKPKPKPGGKRLQVHSSSTSSPSPASSSHIKLPPSKFQVTVNGKKESHSDNDSDEDMDPGDIVLNPDSVAQMTQVDLDVVKRYQMLDNAAQRQKAYLSHGKGLQSRRLPSHLASKVGDDYYEKRKSYDPKVLITSPSTPSIDRKERSQTHIGDMSSSPSKGSLTAEEREKEIMNKVGVPQGTALAGLASIFRKGSSKKLTRSASSSSRDKETLSPVVKVKPTKKMSDTSSPDLSRLKGDGSRSSFKLFKKKKGRLSRDNSTDELNKSTEDLCSETSSLSSISRISIKEEDAFEGNFPQKDVHSPYKPVTSPLKETRSKFNEPAASKQSPKHLPKSSPNPTITSTPLQPESPSKPKPITVTSPTHKKDRTDSLLFKDDASDLFSGNGNNLFDTAELDNLFAKTKTEFEKDKKPSDEDKKNSSPEKHKKTAVESSATKQPLPTLSSQQQVPSKPMRKNRSRVLDTSIYDKAAKDAIHSTKERKLEREKEKELEKKREEEKKKPKISLFEELGEEDDLFGKKTETKKEEKEEKKVISKDDLFDDLDEPVKPVPLVKEDSPKPKLITNELFSGDSDTEKKEKKIAEKLVTDKSEKPVASQDKSTTTDVKEKPAADDVSKTKPSLFDELDDEKTKKTKKDVVQSLFGDDSEKFTSKLTGTSKQNEGKKATDETKAVVTEKTKIEIESEDRKKKQESTAVKSTAAFDDLPTSPTKPKPIVSKKPVVTSPTHKAITSPPPTKTKPPAISAKPPKHSVKPKDEIVKQQITETKPKETEKDVKQDDEDVKDVDKSDETNKEDKLKQKQHDEKKAEDTNLKKEGEKETPLRKTSSTEERKEMKKSEEEKKKNEEKEIERKKSEDNKPTVKEEKQNNTEKNKKEPADEITKKTSSDSKPVIPEWKRKLEEKRLQREKEDRESKERLEERRRKREEVKSSKTSAVTTTAATTPANTASDKQQQQETVGTPKAKPKPSPITSGITVTLSSTSTKEKSPTSPTSESSSSPHLSPPPIDPSLPKWKQDLLAKKKAGGGSSAAPGSPRRSTVSVTIGGSKESDVPAWKKELLAKKKATGEARTPGTSSPRSSRHEKDQPVPQFMKEFQNRKKT